jgi:hypothetical protein
VTNICVVACRANLPGRGNGIDWCGVADGWLNGVVLLAVF